MANTATTPAPAPTTPDPNAPVTPDAPTALVLGAVYNVKITGFTYIREWAVIKGRISTTGEAVQVIIGEKLHFGMRDMFELKNSGGISATYTKDKLVNGVTYHQFQLDEILL